MNKLTVKDIRAIKVGNTSTFQLDSCPAVFNADTLIRHTQRKYIQEDKKTYSCRKDTVNNRITIEAKSID